MKSMTAYAQKVGSIQGKRYRLEIQSLNKKGLDLQLDLPSALFSLSVPLRLFIADHLQRGSVLIRMREEGGMPSLATGEDLANLKRHLSSLASVCGYSEEDITFSMLLDKAQASANTVEIRLDDFLPLFQEGIKALIEMRSQEGERLKLDFLRRFDLIETTLLQIEKEQQKAPLHQKEKLLEKIRALKESFVDDERLAKEVVFYVEKQDVTEELTRLKSHLVQFRELLKKGDAIGRKLEFLVQECFRELNTLAAKSSELVSINLSLILKTEFEKIKEQVMNIE